MIKTKILLRALSYDHALESRAGSEIKLAVLFHKEDSLSRQSAKDLLSAFKRLEGVSVKRLSFSAVALPYIDGPTLQADLRRHNIDVVFLSTKMVEEVGTVTKICRSLKRATMATEELYVKRGVSLAAVQERGRVRIYVNLVASKAEGMRLDAKLLAISQLVQ